MLATFCDKLDKRLKENGLRVRALHPERYLSEGIDERAKTLHGALCFCVWYIFVLCVCNNISPVVTKNKHTEQQNSAPASSPHTFLTSGQQAFDCGHGFAAHREKTKVR